MKPKLILCLAFVLSGVLTGCETERVDEPPSMLMFPNSERLHGKIEVAQYDWRHKNLYHVKVDLAGDDGAALKCEFTSYEKTKFDPNQLWLDPYILIFGPFIDF